MPSLLKFVARYRTPFAASGENGHSSKSANEPAQHGTIRARAAKVIAITALHFGTQIR